MSQKANRLFGGITLLSLFLSSCYNEVKEELEEGSVPIKITADILPPTTRVANDQFENKDAIGFFLLTGSDNLEEAYFKNIPFKFQKGKDFTPSKELYYPKTQDPSKIISYYPYREDILTEDGYLRISTEIDSSNKNKPDLPDFLIAEKENVFADLKPQELSFRHLLAKVEIDIKPAEGYTPEEILSTHPALEIHNLASEAIYDTHKLSFGQHHYNSSLQPKGSWKVEEGVLKGCYFLYIPQEAAPTNQFITIQAENITYKCPFPENWILKSGTINRLTINYTPSKGIEIAKAESDIHPWTEGEKADSNSQIETNAIQTSMFNFDKTCVYQLVNASGKVRAQVCRELLMNKELRTEALVIYPASGEKLISDKGICLKTFDEEVNITGDTITWDKKENTFTLTKCQTPTNSYFFISTTGEICFTQPQECELIHIEELYLDTKMHYPIVKIGTQYWTAQNWKEKQKTDHSPLAYEPDKIVINAGYTTSKLTPGEYFYNRAAVESDMLIPSPWSIPTLEEWQTLLAYIQNDYTLLKSGKWEDESSTSNKTSFGMNQVGSFAKKEFRSNSTCYWAYNPKSKDKLTAIIFQNFEGIDPLEIRKIDTNDYLLSLRLIKR